MNLVGYFDHNATTPLLPQVVDAVVERMRAFGNPSSQHALGQHARAAIERDRRSVARLIDADADRLFFTSGGTESNNLAIRGLLAEYAAQSGHIITSAIEHASVLDVVRHLALERHWSVTALPVNRHGEVDPEDVRRSLRGDTRLIAVMLVNNEIGTLQPVSAIAAIAAHAGVALHVDAVQAAGKVPVAVAELGADTLSLSSHKLHGPKGVGALYIKDPARFSTFLRGGGQERGIRSGTENTAGVAGFAAAADLALRELASRQQLFKTARARLLARIEQQLDAFFINGSADEKRCTPNTLNIGFSGIRGEALAALLDAKYGVSVSLGSACSNNKQAKLSHVLRAIGLSDEQIRSSIRVSFGATTTLEEVDYFAEALISSVVLLRRVAGNAMATPRSALA